jgi:hypothetical protein
MPLNFYDTSSSSLNSVKIAKSFLTDKRMTSNSSRKKKMATPLNRGEILVETGT